MTARPECLCVDTEAGRRIFVGCPVHGSDPGPIPQQAPGGGCPFCDNLGCPHCWPLSLRDALALATLGSALPEGSLSLRQALEAIVAWIEKVPHEESDLKPPWPQLAGGFLGLLGNVEAVARAALAAPPERELGYESVTYGGPCDHCGEPPSCHGCPVVADPPPCESGGQDERRP